MNILNCYIKQILQEEVFGAQAFVYHGSSMIPSKFIEMFSSGQFSPGAGAGAMYGKGLYTVYELENSPTSKGNYGDFVYKLKVNLNEFISFDNDVTKKIYKKDMSPGEQARHLGLDAIGKRLDKTMKDVGDVEYTSAYALRASKYLSGNVKGIIFTGKHDGKVAILYDADSAIITSSKFVYQDMTRDPKEWKRISTEDIKKTPQASKSAAGTWEKKKYDNDKFDDTNKLRKVFNLPNDKRKIEGDILISQNSMLTRLPDHLFIDGDLVIDNSEFVGLGNHTTIEGNLDLRHSGLVSLPLGLKCHHLIIAGSDIKIIPPDLKITGNINMNNTKIKTLPAGPRYQNVSAVKSQLEKLPNNLTFHGDLVITKTKIETLPSGLRVKGDLVVSDTNIRVLPKDIYVLGDIIGNNSQNFITKKANDIFD